MAISHLSLSKPTPKSPAGFGTPCCPVIDAVAQRIGARRRRRELLEHYFSPVVSAAALPSAVDRLVLWRSRHGGHKC